MIDMDDHKTGSPLVDVAIGFYFIFSTLLFYAKQIENKIGPMEFLDGMNDFFGKYGYMFVVLSGIILTVFKCVDKIKGWKNGKVGKGQ